MAYIEDPYQVANDLRQESFGLATAAADLIERLMTENARLREALKPFADEAQDWSDNDEYRPVCCAREFIKPSCLDDTLAAFTVGDLRRAAALLKEGE